MNLPAGLGVPEHKALPVDLDSYPESSPDWLQTLVTNISSVPLNNITRCKKKNEYIYSVYR